MFILLVETITLVIVFALPIDHTGAISCVARLRATGHSFPQLQGDLHGSNTCRDGSSVDECIQDELR